MTLELINRFRLDPSGEFDRLISDAAAGQSEDLYVTGAIRYFGVGMDALKAQLGALGAAAPLAWNEALASAALGHSQLMQAEDAQSHRLYRDADGNGVISEAEYLEPSLGGRAAAQGYDFAALRENVYSYSQNPEHAHAGFVIDWGYGANGMQTPAGHRVNLIARDVTEIGIGVIADSDASTSVGPYLVTQMLGARLDDAPQLLGVAYRDADGDGVYSMGEGMGGVTVRLPGLGRVETHAAGGYQIAAEGPVRVVFSGPDLDHRVKIDLTAGLRNIKLDLVDGERIEVSTDVKLVSGVRAARLLGNADIDATGSAQRNVIAGNDGDNILRGQQGADSLRGLGGDDLLRGGAGADRLRGDAGADRLLGGGGADRLLGGGGADNLRAGAGRDLLKGGGGHDRLQGGAGADRLVGGAGDDFLVGGGGRDLFRFGMRDGADRIADFHGADRIDLRGLGLGFDDIAVSAAGDDARIAFGDTVVIALGAAGDIDADDFLF